MRVKRVGEFRAQALQVAEGRPFFTNSGLQTDSISGQARNTAMQVWTVGEGLGIASEFSQTVCAANNFRDHEAFLRWFKGAGD